MFVAITASSYDKDHYSAYFGNYILTFFFYEIFEIASMDVIINDFVRLKPFINIESCQTFFIHKFIY